MKPEHDSASGFVCELHRARGDGPQCPFCAAEVAILRMRYATARRGRMNAKPRIWYHKGRWLCGYRWYFGPDGIEPHAAGRTPWDAYLGWQALYDGIKRAFIQSHPPLRWTATRNPPA
jgi:hypothetical protein